MMCLTLLIFCCRGRRTGRGSRSGPYSEVHCSTCSRRGETPSRQRSETSPYSSQCVCVCACMILFVRLVAIQGKCEAPVAPRVEFVTTRLSALLSWAPYLCASLPPSFPRVIITSYYTPILILTIFKKT